jgi:hypothetical protein
MVKESKIALFIAKESALPAGTQSGLSALGDNSCPLPLPVANRNNAAQQLRYGLKTMLHGLQAEPKLATFYHWILQAIAHRQAAPPKPRPGSST